MQSGIKASEELQSAFKQFLTSDALALLCTIRNEQIDVEQTIEAQGSSSAQFPQCLAQISSTLTDKQAAYIIIRTASTSSDSNGPPLVAITYTPDAAPVRQKMLFASTRLTLIRELGTEHFSETLFCTTKEEVTPEGWQKHLKHKALDAPLTEGEREEAKLRDEEAAGGIAGTGRREGHYVQQDQHGLGGGSLAAVSGGSGGGMDLPIKSGQGVVEGLEGIKQGTAGDLLVLKMQIPGETLEVDTRQNGLDISQVAGVISNSDPRYTFYNIDATEESKTLFIYTCPSSSKVKERMIYASSRSMVVKLAESKVGLRLDKKLEGSDPSEFSAEALKGEFAAKSEQKQGFARPKRPGRR